MIYYIYDGTFDGLLTAIYEAYYSPNPPDIIITQERYEPNLFSTEQIINTDIDRADRVYNAIKLKISPIALRNVYRSYLSEIEMIETAIYHYLKLGFKIGPRIDHRVSDQVVMKIHEATRKVGAESHRLMGLVRFRLLKNGVYYAPLEPDHNIICVLASHFAQRMSDQPWMIHDLKRKSAVIHSPDSGEWNLISLEQLPQLFMDDEEESFQNLWKTFYKTISIEERTNPRLQKQFMPTRYWKYLIEKE